MHHQGNAANQNNKEVTSYTSETGTHHKNNQCWCGCGGKKEPHCFLDGMLIGFNPFWENMKKKKPRK